MSKHTTIEQFKKLAQRSKAEIDKVDGKVTALSSRVDDLVTAGGEPNKIDVIKNNGTPGLSAGKEESDYHESHRVGLPAQRPCLGVVQLHPGVDGQRADRRKPFSGGAH